MIFVLASNEEITGGSKHLSNRRETKKIGGAKNFVFHNEMVSCQTFKILFPFIEEF